ncbi:MAG: DUF484 family protein [Gammaproteobacteria bacterium]|uniref:DUF484 family protein n=1 Tax=Limnobacter sp. TaxID=2003368 RepID=UPI001DC77571|nr:DUF484 family protein [Limnobacter sp.]MBU0784058.1 DUF484 family protein [Gammaproteobacteria bacterium]MBU0848954.1 DUF484 family protein [Gammaproteobacteria bacterium]MBU1268234.1 DUF484 family protein [Gammaproteobacteria bacterium]MBU1527791.1 DUF484 family protein [Gammaproteobacteria bacterium]MBU1778833.1 DUF484 family protein [Gammaproteobacteria bacterium]
MTDEAIQVADFLKANPDFLIRNPGILAFIKLPEQSSGNVASLHERQVQTMREKVKLLEHRMVEMTHAAVENQAIINNLQTITRSLLTVKNAVDLPAVLVEQIKKQFVVPIVRLQLWNQGDAVSEDDQVLVSNMQSLYCGFAENAPTLSVFQGEEVAPRSVVLIPLRVGINPEAFGCLGFGSPDKDRFSPTLETDFLNTLAETACAALSRLQTTTA